MNDLQFVLLHNRALIKAFLQIERGLSADGTLTEGPVDTYLFCWKHSISNPAIYFHLVIEKDFENFFKAEKMLCGAIYNRKKVQIWNCSVFGN